MIHMNEAEVQEAVDDALDSLPFEVIEQVAQSNTVILVEQEPPPGQHLLGLYEGVPLDQRGTTDGMVEPGRIIVYRGPLQRAAQSRDDLVQGIRVTVLHEIGHLFGIEEDRLHELGWG